MRLSYNVSGRLFLVYNVQNNARVSRAFLSRLHFGISHAQETWLLANRSLGYHDKFM